MSRMDVRAGVEQLPSHLEARYGIEVAGTRELDLGVYRVDLRDGGSWVARVHPAERPLGETSADAAVLRLLAELDYPAERCAAAEPVSVLAGQALLVTGHVPAVPHSERREAIRAAGGLLAVGELLGRLHTLPVPVPDPALRRAGGCWHHLADGGPADEIAAVAGLLAGAGIFVRPEERALHERLRNEIGALDDGGRLPQGLVHPDFVLANLVAPPGGGLVVVDWAGAGPGPRAWSLAFLLWSVGFGGDSRRVDRVVAGYRRRVRPEPEELRRLEALVRARPVAFAVWSYCTGRTSLAEAEGSLAKIRETAASIAARARAAFAA